MTDPQLDLARRAIALRDRSFQKDRRKEIEYLIAQLREAGHEDVAQQVLETELARQLQAAGHGDLAEQLKGKAAHAAQQETDLLAPNESWSSGGPLLES